MSRPIRPNNLSTQLLSNIAENWAQSHRAEGRCSERPAVAGEDSVESGNLALGETAPFLNLLRSGVIYSCIIHKSVQRCKQGDCASVRY